MIEALFSFKWRINRLKYFWYSMLLAWMIFVLAILWWIIFWIIFAWDIFANEHVISLVVWILVSYPALALTIKRFHDLDRNWLWYIPIYLISSIIIPLITIFSIVQTTYYLEIVLWVISLAIGLVLLFNKWTVWINKYGEDPIAEYNAIPDDQKKKSPTRHWLLAFNLLIIWALWAIVSVVFWIIGWVWWSEIITEPGLVDVIKSFINRGLWILSLIWIPGMIVGIVLLVKKK